MAIPPVNPQVNSFQSQDVWNDLMQMDYKIYTLVIVGRLLQGTAVVGSGVAIGLACVISPLVLLS